MKDADRKVVKARKDYHTLIKIVRQNPGIHFRELSRVSGLGYGTLEHQLPKLEKLAILRAHRAGGFTRYYNSDISKTTVQETACRCSKQLQLMMSAFEMMI